MGDTTNVVAVRSSVLSWTAGPVTAAGVNATFSVPTGTVAFLLSDVEGSTLLWERDPETMAEAMARHYSLVDAWVNAHGGVRPQEQGEGDSVVAAFARASDAVLAARDLQRALVAESWPTATPLRVRMAVHAGEARLRDALNYAGEAIIRTARLRAIGHGGQVLVSQAARDLAVDLLGDEVELVDLGMHRLKDLARPEHVWQLRAPGLPESFRPLASLDVVPNNLPSSLSKFIGRSEEIATVIRLLDADRLVTLTGAGGAGKSRLALQVAAEVVDRFGDGVWWVELAPITAGDDVAGAIAAAMGVPDPARGEPLTRLSKLITNRAPLLALDNAEHLIEEVARVADVLLSTCPHLRMLVTSRRPLELAGEVTWRVPSLSCPAESDAPIGFEALGQYDAVNLFVDRARRVRPGFSLSDANAADVADICARLDGLPLAIELAAARCRSMAPARVRAGLADSLRLLNAGSRTVLPRQQTLHASITWSHDLLGDQERAVLRRLGVFYGGFTLPAAESVIADDHLVHELDVLDVLDRLVQHSLVQVHDDSNGESRYRMLETVRQFAARQLAAAGETDALRSRHADWVLGLLRQFGEWTHDEGIYDIWWTLEPEQANVDAGIGALYGRGDHTAVAQALIGLTEWLACSRRYALLVRWSNVAVRDEHRLSTSVVPQFLEFAGVLRALLGRYRDAFPLLQRAHQLAEARADQRQLLRLDLMSSMTGLVLMTADNEQVALANLERARRLADADLIRVGLYTLIGVYITAGRPLEAATYFDEFRSMPKPISATQDALNWEATNARMCGQMTQSLAYYTDVQALDARAGSLGHSTGVGGHALTAFEAGIPGPDEDRLVEILHHATADEDQMGVAMAQLRIGFRAARLGEISQACAAFEVARLAMPATLWAAWADAALVSIHDQLDQPDEMRAAIERLRNTAQPLRLVLADLGDAAYALRSNNPLEAEAAAHQALTAAAEHGLLAHVAIALEVLADAGSRLGDQRDAARLLGAAQHLRDELGAHGTYPINSQRRIATIERLHASLHQNGYDEALAEGLTLGWRDAVAYTQRTRGERKRPAFGWNAITPTELQIIQAATEGLTNAQIARKLLMGTETVKTHLAHIYTKLAVKNRAQLTALAFNNGPNTSP